MTEIAGKTAKIALLKKLGKWVGNNETLRNASFAMGNDLLMRRTSRLDLKNANAQLHFMNWLTEKKKMAWKIEVFKSSTNHRKVGPMQRRCLVFEFEDHGCAELSRISSQKNGLRKWSFHEWTNRLILYKVLHKDVKESEGYALNCLSSEANLMVQILPLSVKIKKVDEILILFFLFNVWSMRRVLE